MLCNYPSCTQTADSQFALLPLCTNHADLIRAETQSFYDKGVGGILNRSERSHRPRYLKIASKIPWSKKRMGQLK